MITKQKNTKYKDGKISIEDDEQENRSSRKALAHETKHGENQENQKLTPEEYYKMKNFRDTKNR